MRSIELDGSQSHFPTDDHGSSIATPRLKGKVRVFAGEKDPIKPFSTAFAESGSPIEPFLTAISKNGGSIGQFLEFGAFRRTRERLPRSTSAFHQTSHLSTSTIGPPSEAGGPWC